MIEEFDVHCEEEEMPSTDDLNLLEVMDLCANLYLSHLLAVEITTTRSEPARELFENQWIDSILLFTEQTFFRSRQIH